LGMTLRALETGAAGGFAELGDSKAFVALKTLIADDKENEQARLDACHTLAWIAGDNEAKEIAKLIGQWRGADKASRFRLSCIREGLDARPLPSLVPALLPLFADSPDAVRHGVARALGKAGLDPATEAELIRRLDDAKLGADAALALLLGGSIDGARRVIEKN